MKRALQIGLSLLAVSAVEAVAADIPMKAPVRAPVVAPIANWTGCYIGGNVGGGWARDRETWTGIVEAPTAFAAGAATVLPAAANADYSATGFVGGGQIGCNYQMGSFVLGGEADAQYTSFRGSRGAVSLGNTNGGPATIVPGIIAESFESNWLATFRGRAGFTTGPILFYVTGGAAWANLKLADQVCFPTAAVPACATGANNNSRLGWTFGGGLEWMFAPNWSVKAEYLYVDLGTVSYASLGTPIAAIPNPFPNAFITHNHRITENIARLGVNFKF